MNRMKCPCCGRRAFDISRLPKEQIEIELKCPNCHKLIKVACVADLGSDNSKEKTNYYSKAI